LSSNTHRDRNAAVICRRHPANAVSWGQNSVKTLYAAKTKMITMKSCMCGYLGHYNGRCHCTPDQVLRYRRKISGPLLDRIDIQIEVPAVLAEDLSRVSSGDSSGVIRERVEQARAKMIMRQGKENARLTTREIDSYCAPDGKGATLLQQAISRLVTYEFTLGILGEESGVGSK